MTDLGTLGGRSSYAWGVNNAGQVTGYSDITGSGSGADRTYHAFLYAGGHMTDLGTLGGSTSYAFGINNAGQVTGYATTAADAAAHAFLYSGGKMIDLGSLGGTSEGLALNNAGHVVGEAYLADNVTYHPFVYANGVMTDIGTLGGVRGYAQGINDLDQVVGADGCGTGSPVPVLGRSHDRPWDFGRDAGLRAGDQ